MSIHGCCFDEGQSGHCGLECRCFLASECTIADEVIEGNKDFLLSEFLGELKYAVLKAQNNFEELEQKELKKILEDYGY